MKKNETAFYKNKYFIIIIIITFSLALVNAIFFLSKNKKEAYLPPIETPIEKEPNEVETPSISKPGEQVETPIEEEIYVLEQGKEASEVLKESLKRAEDYIESMSFSKKGLAQRLKFEGYPEDAISFAVGSVSVDYNEEALGRAKMLKIEQKFTENGIREQLYFDGFEEEEINYAVENLK